MRRVSRRRQHPLGCCGGQGRDRAGPTGVVLLPPRIHASRAPSCNPLMPRLAVSQLQTLGLSTVRGERITAGKTRVRSAYAGACLACLPVPEVAVQLYKPRWRLGAVRPVLAFETHSGRLSRVRDSGWRQVREQQADGTGCCMRRDISTLRAHEPELKLSPRSGVGLSPVQELPESGRTHADLAGHLTE